MDYQALKHIHVTCVVLSGAGFFVRGVWMLRGSPMMHRLWVRVMPHVVDTVLLASAIGLAVRLGQYPFVDGWLTAKVVGLLAYIGLGMVAFRFGNTRAARAAGWAAALAAFAYIVSVAFTRNAAGPLALAA